MDDKQNNSLWLQVTAGQGPKECGWVVAQVLETIKREAEALKLKADLVESLAYEKALRNQDLVEPDAYLSGLLKVEGEAIRVLADRWVGSIKWHGESPFRPKHKRLNWFVGVSQLKAISSKDLDMKGLAKEVVVETMRASGPGGQHVNKTSSAVRVTHEPTGVQVRVESDRSQHRNKQLAMERLMMILHQEHTQRQNAQIKDRWLSHYQVGRGNPVRTFVGHDFSESKKQ